MNGILTIRRAETIPDYRALQDAQRRAWGIAEEGYMVPVATMVGAQLHGGLVLGAYQPDGSAVALSFAFLGQVEGRLCLYSQLTGVVPEHQGHGLGERMKLTQRDLAREQGLERIAWAFDPLQAGNAHFNIARLGASSARYIDDMYGLRTDALNAGVPTDRLIAEWETAPHPLVPLSVEEARRLPRLITASPRPDGRLNVEGIESAPAASRVLLEIPADIAALRRDDPALAETWRRAVRKAFKAAFAVGYRADGFVRDDAGASRRCYYLLRRGDEPGTIASLF
jgi:predicted GNAT superfamily acetyltransferase